MLYVNGIFSVINYTEFLVCVDDMSLFFVDSDPNSIICTYNALSSLKQWYDSCGLNIYPTIIRCFSDPETNHYGGGPLSPPW